MRFGKLTPHELEDCILRQINSKQRSEVILSAAHGEDCAALSLKDLILLSTDPITAKMPLKELGSLAVDVACNDISANGGEPIALLFTVIMPTNSLALDIKTIMQAASLRARACNVDIIGGHTEFSDCVTRSVVSVTAIGSAKRLFKKTDLKANDKIYMTKFAAIEGTVILSKELGNHLSKEELAFARELEKLLSVQLEGRILSQESCVTTMHDITEGGVLGAVAEVMYGANKGALIYKDKIPLHPLTIKLCEIAQIDPLRLISSGSLLFTLSSGDNELTLKKLKDAKVIATLIGEVNDGQEVLLIDKDGKSESITAQCDHLFLAKV